MTALFTPSDGPRVFALPPGVDFGAALVAGLEARLVGQPPEAMARVEIWVNTQRMRRALVDLLARGPARLLPRVRAVTELAEDPLAPGLDSPPVSALRRKLELSRLIGRLLAVEPGLAAETAAFDLADSLADLMDETQGEGVPAGAILGIDAGEHAEHWQRGLRFLTLLADYMAAGASTDGEGRMRAVAAALAERWAARPPDHPVIVAGSTGSRGATRLFMAAVAALPQGALVLPGFDADLPPGVWRRLGRDDPGAADHPQHGFRRLADALGFDPSGVPAWTAAPPPAPARNALVSLALRPAPVTDQWRVEGRAMAPDLAAACVGVTWVEAPDPRSEALTLALALRGAAETGETAALVTPDRMLARRVTAELDRWGILPDDSAGRPLALTPPGVLLRRVAELIGAPLTPEALLILLKHPLTNAGPDARGAHLRLTARLERRLRGGAPTIDWDVLAAQAEGEDAAAWLGWLRASLAPLAAAGTAPLAETVAAHVGAAEALAAGPAGTAAALWDREAGRQARAMTESLALEADAYGAIAPVEYRALLASLMAARDVPEEAVVTHPGIFIWGTLEARARSADLVILGGLNEGVWPRLPGADPWLNRAMRREIGLPSPERRIGLSAHDFQQAAGAPKVIFSRATRDTEAPTVGARWLLRLENLLLGLPPEGPAALAAARARGRVLVAQAARLDRPTAPTRPAPRPAPRPPLSAFPAELSVTQIETLVRDPYEIYASKVLRLRRLDPIGRQPDALTRGSAIHAVLDAFLGATGDALPDNAAQLFRAAAEAEFARVAPWPAVRALWIARLDRATDWFLLGEADRRERAGPLARELRGRRNLDGLAAPMAVTARADRIDRGPDGRYAIYDYKSGAIPSDKYARAFHLQLPLEAAIAEAGGFEGLPAGTAFHLELIGLGARKTLPIDARPEAIAAIWTRLRGLIAFYQTPANGFAARLRPGRVQFESAYDHLARRGEWADGDMPGDWEWR